MPAHIFEMIIDAINERKDRNKENDKNASKPIRESIH